MTPALVFAQTGSGSRSPSPSQRGSAKGRRCSHSCLIANLSPYTPQILPAGARNQPICVCVCVCGCCHAVPASSPADAQMHAALAELGNRECVSARAHLTCLEATRGGVRQHSALAASRTKKHESGFNVQRSIIIHHASFNVERSTPQRSRSRATRVVRRCLRPVTGPSNPLRAPPARWLAVPLANIYVHQGLFGGSAPARFGQLQSARGSTVRRPPLAACCPAACAPERHAQFTYVSTTHASVRGEDPDAARGSGKRGDAPEHSSAHRRPALAFPRPPTAAACRSSDSGVSRARRTSVAAHRDR